MSASASPSTEAKARPASRSFLRLDGKQLRHALRTAVAALLTYLLAETFQLKQGYWAVITSVIVMQANLGGSLAACWSRVLGTAVGALLGVAGVLVFGQTITGLSLGVFLSVLICAYLNKRHDSFRLAGVTAVVVMIAGGSGPAQDIYELGLHRFLEISLGVAVALVTALLVLPSRAGQVLRRNVAGGMEELAALYEAAFKGYMADGLDDAELRMRKKRLLKRREINRKLLDEARKESFGASESLEPLKIALRYTDRVMESIAAMLRAAECHDAEGFRHVLAPALNALFEPSLAGVKALAEHIAQNGPTGARDARPATALGHENALGQALRRFDEELLELRRSRESQRFRFDEVIHFFSFLLAMQEIGEETLATGEALHLSSPSFD